MRNSAPAQLRHHLNLHGCGAESPGRATGGSRCHPVERAAWRPPRRRLPAPFRHRQISSYVLVRGLREISKEALDRAWGVHYTAVTSGTDVTMAQLSKRPTGPLKPVKAVPVKTDVDAVAVLGDEMLLVDAKSLQMLNPEMPQARVGKSKGKGNITVYKARGGTQYFVRDVPSGRFVPVVRGTKAAAIAELKGKLIAKQGHGHLVYGGGSPIDVETVKRVLGITLGSIRQAENLQQPLTEAEVLSQVSKALAAEAAEKPAPTTPEAGWEALLLRGLEYKKNLLASDAFKSTREAAALLGVGDAAIRKRVREGKLFALQMQHTDEYRIPIWALGIGDAARELSAIEPDAWALYHFLVTPSGSLNGLRPFELLLPSESLTPQQLAERSELAQYSKLSAQGPFLDVVLQALAADKSEALAEA